MCSKLQIPFDEMFEVIFDAFSVTGDSGRKGVVIEPRKRRDVSEVIKEEINQSNNFKIFCDIFNGIENNLGNN